MTRPPGKVPHFAGPASGASFVTGYVVGIDKRVAQVRIMGNLIVSVRMDALRGKSVAPKAGETWLLDQPYGMGWMFACPLGYLGPSMSLGWATVTLVAPFMILRHGETVSIAAQADPGYTPVLNDRVVYDENAAPPMVLDNVPSDAPVGGFISAGIILMSGRLAVPSGYLACDGAAVSRATYAALFGAVCISSAASTHTTITIDGIASTTGWQIGWFVSGPGIPAGATIASVAANSITLNVAATATAAITLVVGPYGIGDGTTTFNTPDFGPRFPRGNVLGLPGGNTIHTHPLSDAGQAQITGIVGASPALFIRRITSAAWNATISFAVGGSSSANIGTTGAGLTGATDNNAAYSALPPFQGVAFIIKT